MDVKYIQSDWEKMRDGSGDLIGLGRWGKGMIDSLKDLSDILEEAEADIAKYDRDRVISFTYTSQKSAYQGLFEDYQVLHRFTGKVGDIVDRTIDEPFYKDMDKFVEAVRDLSISNYQTRNHIGATETTYLYDSYGMAEPVEMPKAEVSLDDLLSGGTFYSDQIQAEYDNWKLANPDEKITAEEYRMVAVNSRAFEYESIQDRQENKEFWVQMAALVVIVGVSFVCPVAGIALGAVYGTMELGSAVSGKDWVSGRELDTSERWVRGLLAPLDIIPGVGAISKFGRVARLGYHLTDAGQFGIRTVGAKTSVNSYQVHRLVDQATSYTVARLRNIEQAIKDAVGVVINKVVNDAKDIGDLTRQGFRNARELFTINPSNKLATEGAFDSHVSLISDENSAIIKDIIKNNPGLNLSNKKKKAVDFDDWIKTASNTKPSINTLEEAHRWGNKHFDEWLKTLTDSERDAIRQYTGIDYSIINNYLRGISDYLGRFSYQVIEDIKTGLAKAEVPHDMKVYRGTDIKPFEPLLELDETGNINYSSLIGKTFPDRGFMSTALIKESSFDYMDVAWEINVPKGTNAAYIGSISQHSHEAELLFNAGQEMKINDVMVDNNGKISVFIDVLLKK